MTVLPIKNPWADEWLVYNDDGTSLTLTTEEYEKWKEDTGYMKFKTRYDGGELGSTGTE